MKINLENSSNRKVLGYLHSNHKAAIYEDSSPESANLYDLQTYPDNVAVLWNDFANKLPEKCQWVIHDTAVLVNPKTGIIFGIMIGNYPALLRLNESQRSKIIRTGGASFQLTNQDGVYANSKDYGVDWLYCFSFIENIDEYCLSAYEYANVS